MKYRRLILSAICGVAITGCVSQPPGTSTPAVTWTKDSATGNEKKIAKEKVTSQLKDPESARYGEIWALNGSNGHRTVCGYVNAKNSYGGYTGEKTFTILASDKIVIEGSGVLGNMLPGICMPRTVR